jgi:1-acyl-sn-glycerol-3-phosphate acyltransferase
MGFLMNDMYVIGKKELEKVPLWGPALSFFGVKIDRSNPQQAMGALRKVFTMLKEGESFLIFPEGTRSLDGNLLPFMKGSMKIPFKTGVKIIPFVVNGTEKIMPKGKIYIKHSPVKVIFLDIIDPKEYENDQVLSDYIWNLMNEERKKNLLEGKL